MNSNCRLLYIFFTSLDVIKTVLEPNWRGVDLRCAALRYVHSMELSFCKKSGSHSTMVTVCKLGENLFTFCLFAPVSTHLSVSHHDNVNGKNVTSFCAPFRSHHDVSRFFLFSSSCLCLLCCLKNHFIHHQVDKLV